MGDTKYYCNKHYCFYEAHSGCGDCNAQQKEKQQREQEDSWLDWHCSAPGYDFTWSGLSNESKQKLDDILKDYILGTGDLDVGD